MPTIPAIDQEKEKQLILKEYRNLLRSLKETITTSERKQLRLAFEMALEAHKDMRRKSGEPYIIHPLQVAQIVVKEMGLNATAAICAILHDVVEDTELTLDDIKREFGGKVAKIIDGLTKVSGVFDLTSSIQAENFKKLLLTLADDVRVILIKIADRLHNMRTMDSMPRKKQLKIASETLFLYAPLAHRLGFYAIKSELEDLGMKYTESETYKEIARKLSDTKRERSRYINEFTRPIKERLDEEGMKYQIYGRPKSIHSIWNKMRTKHVTFEEVYDLFAIRIIIDSPQNKEKADCWKVYSIVTELFTPNPDRLRDWISTPKANGYESLHTTVMGHRGRWVEVQIRTVRMDEIAEKGFAAHWKYKEGTADKSLDTWLREIRELLRNPDYNALEFLDDFKSNLFSKEIYVFTPKGDLKILPQDSTALDFAFEIHTDVGYHCIGAKVNHKLVPLSHRLSNGDQVEVITSRKQKPNEDWLGFLITSRARSKVKHALKEEKRQVALVGRDMLEKKMKSLKLPLDDKNMAELMSYYHQPTSLELFYRIQNKDIDLKDLKNFQIKGGRIIAPKRQDKGKGTINPNLITANADLLIFDEMSDKIAYSLAKCCNPIVGDDVFGFITVNEGIKIHRTNCPNATELLSKYGYRAVKTRWTKQQEIAFLTGLKITGVDDVGLVNKVTNVISGEMKLNMQSMTIGAKEGIFEGTFMVYVKNTDELEDLIHRISSLKEITSVTRIET
ncbi:MAG: bifunctional (p)ppGpp synthetase/guanosine-3',5'-bis(diphosphate) 3'-pyrophosphohydrolase [Chitinophagales bacterium]|nr:bifunctional (p)ppGpp synthetase/guanosine-3',5'-bis(diphosphate) 3'-pyrophosphohydrolase [Chitinophagales bacterium]HAE13676.1 RelA/SpoT family protein [Bacteroidota bacterium]MCB9021923.1 bifunctional (p)ppGpp synthetase/guanosine-3',5'-bis(diphosphate) 3'-pyrophosphohydrolase [Chitinophagales bacterium]MCB9030826.1 bifunctional (p)ppGpp synthetase/guanosine-3',5'-bis(diphosphate) 3'-pyrophosphohydrolase [Chitinophagales bacterium]HPE96869.1 bifunctional (p)ppGpp synthetase/guanosine-3',5'